jgi:hypothetical protein
LILDLVIEAGNPADSERFLPVLERREAPRQGGRRTGREHLTQSHGSNTSTGEALSHQNTAESAVVRRGHPSECRI